MAFSHLRGIKLHYIVHDSMSISAKTRDDADRTDKPRRLVFIHGLFFGNLASWYPLFTNALSQWGPSLCYDLRGHGLSEVTESGYQLADHVLDLESLLEELSWSADPICFIGHSFGARVALAISARRSGHSSERPYGDQVIMIDPPLLRSGDYNDQLLEHLNERGIESLKSYLPSGLVTLFSAEGRRVKKTLKRWERLIKETSFPEDLKSLEQVSDHELSSLNEGDAALFGEESGCLPGRSLLTELIPDERNEILEGGGHFLLNQTPERVIAFIRRHLHTKG